jgi:predicted dehydrogenase
VLLEKPPAATLSELEDLRRIADETGRVLFTTWHSQYNRGVDEARRALQGQQVRRLLVTWKEMCATGIRASNGSGRRAASGCSTPASMRFPS